MLVVVGAIAAACGAVVTVLAARGPEPQYIRQHTDIGILTHKGASLEHAADAGVVTPPQGAVRVAAVGTDQIYAWHSKSRNEDCILDLRVATGGVACEAAAKAEAHGVVGVFREGGGATSGSASTMRVIALVPNDVKEVRITDKDGASYTVGVSDNIAVSRDVNTTSLAYRLGNGKEQRTSVATLINRTPN